MTIRFDPKTEKKWRENNISHISIIVTDTGCAGHKIQILEGEIRGDASWVNESYEIHYSAIYSTSLDGAMITWTGVKWILTSSAVNTRCGCGSSFSLKSGNTLHDKLAHVKLAMKEKREGIHEL